MYMCMYTYVLHQLYVVLGIFIAHLLHSHFNESDLSCLPNAKVVCEGKIPTIIVIPFGYIFILYFYYLFKLIISCTCVILMMSGTHGELTRITE